MHIQKKMIEKRALTVQYYFFKMNARLTQYLVQNFLLDAC